MDLARIETQLAELRDRGDCELRPSAHVSRGFISIAPHRVGVAHLMLRPRFLLADPVGCGKTAQALVAYAMLREKNPALRCLVVTTKSALVQWQKAVAKFLKGLRVTVVGFDKGRKGTAAARAATYTLSKADILITTYASMARDVDLVLTSLDLFVAVFDEVQALKSHRQRLLRPAALKVSHKARYAWGLSATPISNRLEELHAVMEVIRPGLFGSERSFQDTYLRRFWIQPKNGGPGFWKVLGHQHLDQLMLIMRPFYLRRPASVIDAHLPAVVTKEIVLDALPEQAALYDEIVEQYFLPANPMRNGKPVTKLASLTYAQQVADAPTVLGYDVRSAKEAELLRFLQEEVTDEKVIIYARYERVVSYLAEILDEAGIPSARITGKESALQREAAKQLFNTTPDTNVIVLTAAGGQAIDLQAASLVVFYDLPWSWGEFQQVLGRARRLGSKHPKVLAVLLAIANTIDTFTLATLARKESLVALTIEADESTAPAGDEEAEEAGREVAEAAEREAGASGSFLRAAFQAVLRSRV